MLFYVKKTTEFFTLVPLEFGWWGKFKFIQTLTRCSQKKQKTLWNDVVLCCGLCVPSLLFQTQSVCKTAHFFLLLIFTRTQTVTTQTQYLVPLNDYELGYSIFCVPWWSSMKLLLHVVFLINCSRFQISACLTGPCFCSVPLPSVWLVY